MGYHVVDMSADPRCGQFAYFRRMTFPFAGITAEVDITDLMAARNGRPFFLSMLYAVTRAVNAVPQLRRRITEDGAVVEYDWCAPSYTAMKPDGVYVYCTVEGDLPYDEFVRLGQSRQREVLERGTLTEDGDIRGMIFVSSVPWLHYTQLQHPAESPDDSNPRISWGQVRHRQRPYYAAGVPVRQPRAGRRPPYRQIFSGAGDGTGRPVRTMESRTNKFII